MTPDELDRLAKLAGIPIPKETPMPDTVPQIADGAADGALPPCWPKTGYVTRERYCGKHGRAAGWPCRGGGPVSGESRPVWPGGGEYQAYGLGAARAAETVSGPPETAPAEESASDPVSSRTDALRAPDGPAPPLKACCDGLVDAGVVGDQTRAALRRVVDLHQPETVDVDGACTRYGDEPGSGCCGACDLTTTTTVCTCGAGLDLMPCPTLVVIADALGVALDADAPPVGLAALLRARTAEVDRG